MRADGSLWFKVTGPSTRFEVTWRLDSSNSTVATVSHTDEVGELILTYSGNFRIENEKAVASGRWYSNRGYDGTWQLERTGGAPPAAGGSGERPPVAQSVGDDAVAGCDAFIRIFADKAIAHCQLPDGTTVEEIEEAARQAFPGGSCSGADRLRDADSFNNECLPGMRELNECPTRDTLPARRTRPRRRGAPR